jgi:hypothetical protein
MAQGTAVIKERQKPQKLVSVNISTFARFEGT